MKVAPDKLLHFLACYAVTLTGYVVFHSWLLGAAVAAVLAVGKEVLDKLRGGKFDWGDLAWGGVGIAVAGIGILLKS